MLILKVNKHSFYGLDHPEGQTLECECYKIDENMTSRDIENLINRKTKKNEYLTTDWEILKVEEDK